ncbi:MAG: RNA-dependent DNA polymerase [Methylobacter sp.]|nr:RNA-dependent DNA polymerase [Methylobacter sp.]
MPKRLNHLWPGIVSFENLLRAYRKARQGKQQKDAVAQFTLNLETELLDLQQQLITGSYRPGEYRLFTLYERKPRIIAAAPFRDRIVHHALLNVVDPLMDRRFIDDSYACRQQKGVHKAVDRYQGWAKRYAYALKMDIKQYFPSIDHALLKQKLARHIKDAEVLNLFALIIDTAPVGDTEPTWFIGDDIFSPLERRKGLPIGNLTSQFLANLYLNDFDHFVKEQLRVKAYLRYVDDFIVLGDDKAELWKLKTQIQTRLDDERLRLHPNKMHVVPTYSGLDVLGYYVFPGKRLLRNDNGHRFARKLRSYAKAYADYKMDWCDFNPRVQSWIGHACHADTLGLRRKIFSDTLFRRGPA